MASIRGQVTCDSEDSSIEERLDLKLNPGRRIALITGSAGGIGKNIALDLCKRGFYVILNGRDDVRLQRTVDECNQCGNTSEPLAFSCQADLKSSEGLDRLVSFVKCNFKRLDILVNNLGYRGGDVDILSETGCIEGENDIDTVMYYNLSIPAYLASKCCKLLFNHVDADRKAIIINISSIAGQVTVPLYFYSVAKACLSELSKQLGVMSDHTKVVSCTISPGPVITDERPHHAKMAEHTMRDSVASTQEISNIVMYAIDHMELFNGKEIVVDGGYTAKQRQPSRWRLEANTD